jgi:AcrR family transcriptional regulator
VIWNTVKVPRTADRTTRAALLETAARLLTEHGAQGLTLRRLTSAVGTSTMAVYTHCGSMEEVVREVRREGFSRLAARLDAVAATDDPLADLGVLGIAYLANAIENPHLYRTMFGGIVETEDDQLLGVETLVVLIDAVARAVAARRLRRADPTEAAMEIWAATHGVAMLHLGGFLTGAQVLATFSELGEHLFVGLGAKPAALRASLDTVAGRSSADLALLLAGADPTR